MFDSQKVKDLKDEVYDLKDEVERLEDNIKCSDNIIDDFKENAKQAKHDHKLALSDKDHEIKHFKDNELKTAELKAAEFEQKNAVLEEKVEMLEKMIDIDADIIDVKEIINSLIEKLPTVNFDGIAATAPAKGGK